MLHIHCGDSSAETLSRSGVEGEVATWCDLLYEGPLPAELSEDELRKVRATHLVAETDGALDRNACLSWLERQDARLEAFPLHDEVVLWFDACMYDQLILIRHLEWFRLRKLGKTKLSLICVGDFSGFVKFKGLGELHGAQMRSMLPTRQEVSPAQFALARRAWDALRSADPASVEAVLDGETFAPLPFLGEALRRFLEEYPSTFNGLSRLQDEALRAVDKGGGGLVDTFRLASDMEERPFFGDTTLWAKLNDMASASFPLLRIDGPGGHIPVWNPPQNLSPWTACLTDEGRAVLAGKADFIGKNGIDRWLGGVHLVPGNLWRRDIRTGRLSKNQGAGVS